MHICDGQQNGRLHILTPVPILTRILRIEASLISVPDISQVLLAAAFPCKDAYADKAASAITQDGAPEADKKDE